MTHTRTHCCSIATSQTKVSGLIVDADGDSDEGDFIVEEFVGGGDIDVKFSHTTIDGGVGAAGDDDDGVHGALVQRIIQSKRDFAGSDEVRVFLVVVMTMPV